MVDAFSPSNPYGTSFGADVTRAKIFNNPFQQTQPEPAPLPTSSMFNKTEKDKGQSTAFPTSNPSRPTVLDMGNNRPQFSQVTATPAVIKQQLPQSTMFAQQPQQFKVTNYGPTQSNILNLPPQQKPSAVEDANKLLSTTLRDTQFYQGLTTERDGELGKLRTFRQEQSQLGSMSVGDKINKFGGDVGFAIRNAPGDFSQTLTGSRTVLGQSAVDATATLDVPILYGGKALAKLGGIGKNTYLDLETRGITKLAEISERAAPNAPKVFSWANKVPENAWKALGKEFIVKQVPRTLVASSIALNINKYTTPKDLRNDPEWNSFRRELESKYTESRMSSPTSFAKGIVENIPLTNIVTNKLLGTDEEVRKMGLLLGKERGYSEDQIKKYTDGAIAYRVRARPTELLPALAAGTTSEGMARDLVGKTSSTFTKYSEMGTKELIRKFSNKVAFSTAPIGAAESLLLGGYKQFERIGPEGPTGVKLNLRSTYGNPQSLNESETNKLFSEIPKTNKGVKDTSLIDQSNKTVETTKYRLNKGEKIYEFYVNDVGEVVKATQKDDLSRKIDLPQLGIDVGTGALTTGITNKLLSGQQAKDVLKLDGGPVVSKITKSGKFTAWDLVPKVPTSVPNIKGKLKIGASTEGLSGDVGVTPSSVRQGLAYLTDPTEYLGDKAQDVLRRWGGIAGRKYSESTITFEGKQIPFRTKVNTLTGVFNVGGSSGIKSNNVIASNTLGKSSLFSEDFTTAAQSKTDISKVAETQAQTNIDTNTNIDSNTGTTNNQINNFINSETNSATNTATQTNMNIATNTSVSTMANTFQYIPAMFPGLGMLGGFETKGGTGSGTTTGGRNINRLRNFFFDKTSFTQPIAKGVKLSTGRKSLSVSEINVRGNLGKELGYNKLIASNSTPFNKQSMKRMVKKR